MMKVCRRASAATALVAAAASACAAGEVQWQNPSGGSFQEGGNWAGGAAPESADDALFNLGSARPYTVTLTRDAEVFRFLVGNDRLTIDPAGHNLLAVGRFAESQTLDSFRLGLASGQSAEVSILAGGVETRSYASIGSAAGSSGSLALAGGDARLLSSRLFIGDFGRGSLDIGGGAVVRATSYMAIGAARTGDGTVSVHGVGSLFDVSPVIELGASAVRSGGGVGRGGRAALSVTDGGAVRTTAGIVIGSAYDNVGSAIVSGVTDGTRSTLTALGGGVGVYGRGTLVVADGALVEPVRFDVGSAFGSDGQVTVGGSSGGFDAEIHFTRDLRIASNEGGLPASPYSGSVTVNAGGRVHGSTFTQVGNAYVGTGTINVNGGAFSTGQLILWKGAVTLSDGSFRSNDQRIGSGVYNATAEATFTQTGGTNAGLDGPNDESRPAALSITGSDAIPATYNLAGGTLRANVNNGHRFNYTGGTLVGNVTNGATGRFSAGAGAAAGAGASASPRAVLPIDGSVTNAGTFRITGADVVVAGRVTNSGTIVSDGGSMRMASLDVGRTGVITAAAGDRFVLSGDFTSQSDRAAGWDTRAAELRFERPPAGAGGHVLSVTGADLGPSRGGYGSNYAWGTLALDGEQRLTLQDGNSSQGGGLYVGALDLADGLRQLESITGNGLTIYYDPALTDNAYLGGRSYPLAGGGSIAPVPEPGVSGALTVLGSAGLLSRGRRRCRRA